MKQSSKTKKKSQNNTVSEPDLAGMPAESDKKSTNQITTTISPELERMVENLSDNDKQAVVNYLHQEYFSGPLPHPTILNQYEKICPGLADRIVAMAEKDQKYNIEIRQKTLQYQGRDGLLGSLFAFSTIFIALASGTFLIYTGNDVGGFVALISAVCAGAKVFFGKSKENSTEEKTKEE